MKPTDADNGEPHRHDPLADYRLSPGDAAKPARRDSGPDIDDADALRVEIQAARLRAMMEQQTAPRTQPGVWPPSPYSEDAPSEWDELVRTSSTHYQSAFTLARVVTALTVFSITILLLILGGTQISVPLPTLHMIVIALWCIYACDTIVFLLWTHRIYMNLASFGVSGLKCSPGMAVVSFFIPCFNLYLPHRRLQDAWKASDPDTRSDLLDPLKWQKSPAHPFITIWWCLFLVAGYLSVAALAVPYLYITGVLRDVGTIWLVNSLSSCQEQKVLDLKSRVAMITE